MFKWILTAMSVALLWPSLARPASERTFEPNVWAQIAIPGGITSTAGEIFLDDGLAADTYGRSWVIFGWTPPADASTPGAYYTAPLDQPLEQGVGYWFIHFSAASIVVDLPASDPPDADTVTEGCAGAEGCVAVPIASSNRPVTWSMLGNPVDAEITLGETRIVTDGGECASGCSLAAAGAASIFNRDVFRYKDAATGYEVLSAGDVLQPWDGYWGAALSASQGLASRWLVPTEEAELPPVVQGDSPDLDQYTQVFGDEFDGPALDPDKWNTGLLWGPYQRINNEEQLYVDTLGMHPGYAYDPFEFTDEGTLKITASAVEGGVQPPPIPPVDDESWNFLEYRKTPVNPEYDAQDINYLSGIITSYESFKFAHGYAEIRARLPAGRGLWPAFWMLPTHYVEDVPEIDAMEFLGDNATRIYQTYHYFDPDDNWRLISTESFQTNGPDFTRQFHTYGVAWEPKQIIFYVDGEETHRVSSADYDIAGQAMYLIANLAVGGNWPGSPDASTVFPASYEIDYIRAYKKKVASPIDLSDYQLMFSDEFSGTTLDATKWNTRFLWGPFNTINREEQYYVDVNGVDRDAGYSPFEVAGGNLTITAEPAANSPPAVPRLQPPADDAFFTDNPASWFNADYELPDYTSGMITSYDAFKFAHGYAEIRAQVPEGDGLWPAFWLLNAYYVGPKPEIDVMEIRGENTQEVVQTYHYFDEIGNLVSSPANYTLPAGRFSDGFHTFGVQWQPGRLDWYVDGNRVRTLTSPEVAYQLMYVIANLAVGGAFNTVPTDPSALPADLVIDYIRVYQERGTP